MRIGIHTEHVRDTGRRFCEGISEFARERPDWELVFFEEGIGRARDLEGLDGFIWAIPDAKTARRLVATGKPVVDTASKGKYPGTVGVAGDHVNCGKAAARHFLTLGFVNFGYFGWEGLGFSDDRGRAFAAALKSEGVECLGYRPGARISGSYLIREVEQERFAVPKEADSVVAWVRQLPKPVAVFCANDYRAWQLNEICRLAEFSVPGEVAILGAGNDELACLFTGTRISSVDTGAKELGVLTAKTLDDILSGRRRADDFALVEMEPRGVVERESTAVYPIDPPWLAEAMSFIHANVPARLTADDVCRKVCKSYGTVAEAFRTKLGTTIQKVIAASRLHVAEQLLKTSHLSLTEISRLSGFKTPQYFCACFRDKHGCSPTDFVSNL